MEVVLKRKNDNTFLKFFILYISDHELVTGRCQFPNGPVYFNFWNRIFTEFQWIGANLIHPALFPHPAWKHCIPHSRWWQSHVNPTILTGWHSWHSLLSLTIVNPLANTFWTKQQKFLSNLFKMKQSFTTLLYDG